MDALAPAVELSALIRSGELRSAGEWLISRYAADVVSFCRSWVRERELAEDLAQDVFSSAFANLRSFRAEASPRTWLLSIARNRCIDHTRRVSHEPFADGIDESNEPDAHADDGPLPGELLLHKTYVEAALGELDESDRALVILRFRHGLEYPELANVFGLREGTVRMRLSRALARMRQALELREQMPAARSRAALVPAIGHGAFPESEARPPPPDVLGGRPPLPAPPAGMARPPVPQSAPASPPPLASAAERPAARAPAPSSNAAIPPPAAIAPAPTFGAPSPAPPRGAPSPAPPVPGTVPVPARSPVPAREKAGLWATLRRWLGPVKAPPPVSDFARALAPDEPDVSERMVEKLSSLVANLPPR